MSKNKRRNKPNNAYKNSTKNVEPQAPVRDSRAYYENPLSLVDAVGYKDRNFSLSYSLLSKMATKNAVISSILITRINQVSMFTKPARYSSNGIGYRIKLRSPDKVPTNKQKKAILALEMFIENCGFDTDIHRHSFTEFVKMTLRDSLVYDQLCFEIVPDRMGRPSYFLATDASTIRAASNKNRQSDYSNFSYINSQDVDFVQVIDNKMVNAFSASEMAFGVRNPRTSINLQPYGFGELEQIINQVTSHLFAEEYNSRYFSQGGTTKGIINIKGKSGVGDRENIESFKRQWKAQVSGLYGAWKTPILQVPEGLEYLNVSQSNREMEFQQWMNYLINICCAVYQIDPSEVNFPNNGGVGGKSSLINNDSSDKLDNSKDKGLRPLLAFLADLINKYLVAPFSDDFIFEFVGDGSKSDKEIAELESAAVKTYKTVNEVRAEHDMPPLENGDMLLDGVYAQAIIQAKQREQQLQIMTMQALQNSQMMNEQQMQPGEQPPSQPEDTSVTSNEEESSNDEQSSPENYKRQYSEMDAKKSEELLSIEFK